MKKIIALFVILMLMMTGITSFAEYDKPIQFRGCEWGCSTDEAMQCLPAELKWRNFEVSEYVNDIEEELYDGGDTYKGQIGGYLKPLPSSIESNGLTVAGYQVSEVGLRFAFDPNSDGILDKDADHAKLYCGYYTIEPKDPDAVYSDLLSKLSTLYGEPDNHISNNGIISRDYNIWNGADDTSLSLGREDYSSGSHYIYIKYATITGNDWLKTAYDALVYEETLNAASSFEGL